MSPSCSDYEDAILEDSDYLSLDPINTPPIARYHSPSRPLSVTDLVAPAWCQLQFAYALESGKKYTTSAMRKGQEVHTTLELEMHESKPVVHATSKQDIWALRFINILFSLTELETHRKTRELTVFGFVKNTPVLGMVDEVSVSETGCLTISEYKTRVNPTIFSKSQLKQTSFQLMLYKQLLHDLISAKFDVERFSNVVGANVDACLTDAFIAEMAQDGILSVDTLLQNNTLRKLWEYTKHRLSRYSVNEQLYIHYIHQSDSSCFASQSIYFDPVYLEKATTESLGWWTGKSPPTGVDIEESFKCSQCHFAENCSWRLAKVKESIQRHRALRESIKSTRTSSTS